MIYFKKGNLLESEEKFIVHQCNCISKNSSGLAKQIFNKYPWSYIYDQKRIPGDIIVSGNGEDKRYIIHLMGQIYPGKYLRDNDSQCSRENYFKQGLYKISLIKDLESIAFPWKIGCGLARGNWKNYLSIIENFSEQIDTKVVIYKY